VTQSRIERLLEQMSVQRPSDALDARIQECLDGEACASSVAVARRSTAWPTVAVVAVASLLLGMMLGRGLSEPSAAAAWSAGPSPGSLPEGASPSSAAAGVVAIPAALRDSNWLQQISAPDVVLMCAAGVPQPAAKGADGAGDHRTLACVTCHTGMAGARRQFLAHHSGHDRFVACRLCHDSGEVENL